MHAGALFLAEASFVFRRMAQDGTLAILKHLTSFLIHLEALRLRFEELLVPGWAELAIRSTGLREYPSPGRYCIKDDLKLLRSTTKPEGSLISHILQVLHGNVNNMSLLLNERDMAVFSDDCWDVKCLRQSKIGFFREWLLVFLISVVFVCGLRETNGYHAAATL